MGGEDTMSKAADQARAEAERLMHIRRPRVQDDITTDDEQPAEQPPPRPAAVRSRAKRVKPFQFTVDHAPGIYGEFKDWTAQVERDLERGVPRAEVMRILLRQMLADEALQQRVIAALREGR
jgi:hypothetical protein